MADTCRCHLPLDPPAPPATATPAPHVIAVSARKRQDLGGLGAETPITAAHRTFWWPRRDPEPGPQVRAVAMHGADPRFLRQVRVPGGWHTEGSGANHPDCTPPRPWPAAGRCWAGTDHPVVDVTHRR